MVTEEGPRGHGPVRPESNNRSAPSKTRADFAAAPRPPRVSGPGCVRWSVQPRVSATTLPNVGAEAPAAAAWRSSEGRHPLEPGEQ